jgi:serine protease
VTARLTPGSSTADYDLYLYDAAGTQVARSTLGAGRVDAATARNAGTATATYYVRTTYYRGTTGPSAGAYTLQLGW